MSKSVSAYYYSKCKHNNIGNFQTPSFYFNQKNSQVSSAKLLPSSPYKNDAYHSARHSKKVQKGKHHRDKNVYQHKWSDHQKHYQLPNTQYQRWIKYNNEQSQPTVYWYNMSNHSATYYSTYWSQNN